jgi:beta-mannosidase
MRPILLTLLLLAAGNSFSQNTWITLSTGWQFRQAGTARWYAATVPGTVHTDLLQNKLIPDPFFGDNEKKLQWVDKVNWEYRTVFDVAANILEKNRITLVFEGLDTYADVFLNGKRILTADNMFRGWEAGVKQYLKPRKNILLIRFTAAQNKVDSIARSELPRVLPDNSRVYARKAQFQFGWDWGPKFVGCGIWKEISLNAWNGVRIRPTFSDSPNNVKLIQQKDTAGISFYFEKEGKPLFIKGANWIPADIFLPRVKEADYRRLLQMAKDANMNMLRVWGGGAYEDDAFYDICDELGIMVWQDFMFAGSMYPGDDAFFKNVKEEVRYQVERLKHHPCIVLWCGNNEIDEAWHNWGWQQQFNLHGKDSAQVWNDYRRLFEDSLRQWVDAFDGTRPYIPSSPKFGWGNEKSYKEGDSHYWGLWWGMEDWEKFYSKTGRFVSEFGMQAMPNMATTEKYTLPADREMASKTIQVHQKANEGFQKLDHYLARYFIDSARIGKLGLENYTYLTQCLQYYILKNSIAVHIGKQPHTMGTLLWQFNDCWPAISWSITDYSRQPKAAWYAVKQAYREDITVKADSVYPKALKLTRPQFTLKPISRNAFTIQCTTNAKYVYLYRNDEVLELSDNYFDLQAGEQKKLYLKNRDFRSDDPGRIRIKSLYDVLEDHSQ